jgi:hypothetical protein
LEEKITTAWMVEGTTGFKAFLTAFESYRMDALARFDVELIP